MRKQLITWLMVLAFVCSSLLLAGCCAGKKVQVSDEDVMADSQEMGTEQAREGEAVAMEDLEAYGSVEVEEKSQDLLGEISGLEADVIYFDFDKSDLTPEAKAMLEKMANWLNVNSSFLLTIDGNCDERGTNEYNLALGERRAHAAKRFLADLGISEDRISTISYGEERPVDSGHNEEAWAKNRRDGFKLNE